METTPPEWLNWDLWQGPAPRRPFRSNVVHYNWHWFRHWGTGEISNNAEHEIDIALWALQEKYPESVTSTGGRFHYVGDDWEFSDTQLVIFEFQNERRIIWDGRSFSNLQPYNRGRGTLIYGAKGTFLLDRNGYVLHDLAGKSIKKEQEAVRSDGTNITGEDILTVQHFDNWHHAITQNERLNAPISAANVSNLLCHIGNIAQDLDRRLHIDRDSGYINDSEAMKKWHRNYEPGWEIE